VPTAFGTGAEQATIGEHCAVVAVILFNVAALKVVGALFTLGALMWAVHAVGR
jgi:hypothetical protein